jgi:hypothetical protein
MKADDIISGGNTFALTFIVTFAFVYFAIIEPHFARDHFAEQHIENTLQQITATEIRLLDRLDRIRSRESYLGSLRAGGSLAPVPAAPKKAVGATPQVQKDEEESELLIREKLIQLGVAHQALSKAKAEKKNYAIPIISVSVDEETLLKFFPVLVLIGLVRLLFYRAGLLRVVPSTAESFLPIWIAPLPFGRTSVSFWKWVGVNLLGFIESGSIIFLTLRFVFLYARENHALLKLVAVETLLILAWTLTYLFLVISAIRQMPSAPVVRVLEPEIE